MVSLVYPPIPTDEVSWDDLVRSGTFLRLRQRDNHVKTVSEGTNDDVKIPADVVAIQAPSSGAGLTADRFNHEHKTGVLTWAVGVNGPESADTGVPATANKIPLFAFGATGDGSYLVDYTVDDAGFYQFIVNRSGATTAATVTWRAFFVGAT